MAGRAPLRWARCARRQAERPAALAPLIAEIARPGDYVVCLGAGTITQWANQLPKELNALKPQSGSTA